jgi:hypothetical protein
LFYFCLLWFRRFKPLFRAGPYQPPIKTIGHSVTAPPADRDHPPAQATCALAAPKNQAAAARGALLGLTYLIELKKIGEEKSD